MSEDTGQRGYPILKVILIEDWYACSSTVALLYYLTETSRQPIPLNDPSGLITWDLAAVEDEGGDLYLPAGTICLVTRPQDAFDGHYELLHTGQACQGSGSGGSGSAGSGSEGSGSGGSGSGSAGSSSAGSGTCCQGSCATAICCPTDCSTAPALKAAATFPVAETALNVPATALTRSGCTWGLVNGGNSTSIGIACVNGGWVVTVQGGTSTQYKSDPLHVGSPYPPSGDYICDIYETGVAGGSITVTISK